MEWAAIVEAWLNGSAWNARAMFRPASVADIVGAPAGEAVPWFATALRKIWVKTWAFGIRKPAMPMALRDFR